MRNYLESTIAVLMGAIVIGFVLFGFTGCAENTVLQPIESSNKINSFTASELMENFVLAYGGRDLGLYEQLLHEDFIYTFNPDAVKGLGPVYEYFTKEDELITAANMFSGEPVVNSRGQTVAAITGIEFLSWEQAGDWELTEDMECRGGLCGVFECDIYITRDGDRDFHIKGQQMFTVVLSDISDNDDGIRPNYQILGWQDLSAR